MSYIKIVKHLEETSSTLKDILLKLKIAREVDKFLEWKIHHSKRGFGIEGLIEDATKLLKEASERIGHAPSYLLGDNDSLSVSMGVHFASTVIKIKALISDCESELRLYSDYFIELENSGCWQYMVNKHKSPST